MTVPRKSRQHFSYTSNGDATVNIPLRIKSIDSISVYLNGVLLEKNKYQVSDIRTESPYFFAFTCNPPLKKDDEVIIFQNYLIQREHDYVTDDELTAEGYNKYEDDLTIMIHDLDQNVDNFSMRFAPQDIASITPQIACIVSTPVWTNKPAGLGPLVITSSSTGSIILSGIATEADVWFEIEIESSRAGQTGVNGQLTIGTDEIASGSTGFVRLTTVAAPIYSVSFELRVYCNKLEIPVPEGPGIRSLSWNPQGEWEFDASTPSSILDDLAVNSSESAAGANMVGYYTGEEGSTVQEGITSKWMLGLNNNSLSGADFIGYYDGEAGKSAQEGITSKYILSSSEGCRKISYERTTSDIVTVQSELTSIRNLLTVLESGCECPSFASACIVGTVHWDNKPATSGPVTLGALDTVNKGIEVNGIVDTSGVFVLVSFNGEVFAAQSGPGGMFLLGYGSLEVGQAAEFFIQETPTNDPFKVNFYFKLGCPAPA